MAESSEVVIEEDILLRAIRDYKPTSSSSSGQSQNCKIRKVQPHDRPQENTRSPYTPKTISIGPLHHGKPQLQPMEDAKHKYLNQLLNRRRKYRNDELSSNGKNDELSNDGKNDEILGILIARARKMEQEVRGYYELSNTFISSDDFVHMLVIDGCFLLELLLPMSLSTYELGWQGRRQIHHDILLFENQIPFSVLQAFFEILWDYGVYYCIPRNTNLWEVAYDYLYTIDYGVYCNKSTFRYSHDKSVCATDSVRHLLRKPSTLLHFYHMMLFSENDQPPFINRTTISRKWKMALFSWLFVIVSTPMYFIHKIFFADIMYQTNFTSASEIEEAGVRLKGSRVDLRFDQGTLLIPVLTLNQQSLCLLKNLMVFESNYRSVVNNYVQTYVCFLSDLIKNPGDLKVMEKHHIIITNGGVDESFRLVSDLLSKYENEYDDENLAAFNIHYVLAAYCQKPRHRWYAKLMKDYFGNPWSTLGVLVGVTLLVLTTLQTVFTVLSYYHQQIGG